MNTPVCSLAQNAEVPQIRHYYLLDHNLPLRADNVILFDHGELTTKTASLSMNSSALAHTGQCAERTLRDPLFVYGYALTPQTEDTDSKWMVHMDIAYLTARILAMQQDVSDDDKAMLDDISSGKFRQMHVHAHLVSAWFTCTEGKAATVVASKLIYVLPESIADTCTDLFADFRIRCPALVSAFKSFALFLCSPS